MAYKIFSPNYDECPMLDLSSDSSCRDAIWQTGHIIDIKQNNLARLVFNSAHEHIMPFPDFAMDGNGCTVFSERLKNLLTECGIDNIHYFPATVIEFETGVKHDNYFAGNIIGRIDCMDYEKSQYKEINGKVFRIENLVIDEENILGAALFRLKDVPRIILANESIEEKLRASKITGLHLIPVHQWDNAFGYR